MFEQRPQKIIASIEARMTSSRLPGKVMLPIAGVPALELLIRRLQKSRYLDGICVATTVNPADDELEALTARLGVACFRGSELDVLDRVLRAAQSQGADIIVEITGDCPLMDPALVDRGIEEFFSRDADYSSNVDPATYPRGFDVQVFPTSVLADVASRTQDPIDRTHVSYYIYTHKDLYRCRNWEAMPDEHDPDGRVTLDEEADYQTLQEIAGSFQDDLFAFSACDVVKYLREHPDVANKHVVQKEAHEL